MGAHSEQQAHGERLSWSFAILAVFLRQRGSPESKPVGAPIDDATGQEG